MKQTFLGYPHEDERAWIAANYKEPNPLCFTAVDGDATVCLQVNGKMIKSSFFVSIDDGEWQEYQVGLTVELEPGLFAKFKAAAPMKTLGSPSGGYNFIMTGKIAASGDVTTMLEPAGNVLDLTTHMYAFAGLFKGCSSLVTAPLLPSTMIGEHSYAQMFEDCTSLDTMPDLPMILVLEYGCAQMFRGCVSLKQPKNLLAIMVDNFAYALMLENCIALQKAPVINAIELGKNACYRLFAGCKSLNEIQFMMQYWLDEYGVTEEWVANVSDKGTFKCLPTLPHDESYFNSSHIPVGWNVEVPDIGNYLMVAGLDIEQAKSETDVFVDATFEIKKTGDKAPDVSLEWSYDLISWQAWDGSPIHTKGGICYIRAPESGNKTFACDDSNYNTIAADTMFTVVGDVTALLDRHALEDLKGRDWCFAHLFENASIWLIDSSLMYINTISMPSHACKSMFEGSSIMEQMAVSAKSYEDGCFEAMYKNCIRINDAILPPLPEGSLAKSCFKSMFEGCTRLYDVINPFSYSYTSQSCFERMFAGCEQLEEFPTISIMSEAMAERCMAEMFDGCRHLRKLDVNFKSWRDDINATQDWVRDVADDGIFNCKNELEKKFDASHIPAKWQVELPIVSDAFKVTPTNCALDFGMVQTGPAYYVEFEYSDDNGETWNLFLIGSEYAHRIDKGQTFMLRASENGNAGINDSLDKGFRFFANVVNVDNIDPNSFRVDLSGDITTLLDRRGGVKDIPSCTFCRIFDYGDELRRAVHTIPYIPDGANVGEFAFCSTYAGMESLETVPAITLGKVMYCAFEQAFIKCRNLTSVGDIAAEYVDNYAFHGTFTNCDMLAAAPSISVANLNGSSFEEAFSYCMSLSSVEEISYKEATDTAFFRMFNGDTLLKDITLNAKTLTAASGNIATYEWLNDAANEKPATLHCPQAIADEIDKKFGRGISTIPDFWQIDVMK